MFPKNHWLDQTYCHESNFVKANPLLNKGSKEKLRKCSHPSLFKKYFEKLAKSEYYELLKSLLLKKNYL